MLLRLLITALLLMSLASCKEKEDKQTKQTDTNTPLHLIKPDYPLNYGEVNSQEIENALFRIHSYLDGVTPYELKNETTGKVVEKIQAPEEKVKFSPGDFRITSYEWGVTYVSMLSAYSVTGDERFRNYVFSRLGSIADMYPFYSKEYAKNPQIQSPIQQVIAPQALDDAGSMCTAFLKAEEAGLPSNVDPIIRNYIDFIINKQYRLDDGTLARNRPLKNTLWIDDLFMSVPALAQTGKQTNDSKYFDEAVKQVIGYSERMFNEKKGLYLHGWVEGSKDYPQYHWGRANGWAFMAMAELLEVLPNDYPGRDEVMKYFVAQAKGLASYQSGSGLWHQLVDRNDSYLETSASAIYTYVFAKAINNHWLDYRVFGPLTLLGWNAIEDRINENGQIEGICVGTGMGFDPMFYYYRPTSVYAAHGYGPVILAGSEVIKLLKTHKFNIDETAVQFSSE